MTFRFLINKHDELKKSLNIFCPNKSTSQQPSGKQKSCRELTFSMTNVQSLSSNSSAASSCGQKDLLLLGFDQATTKPVAALMPFTEISLYLEECDSDVEALWNLPYHQASVGVFYPRLPTVELIESTTEPHDAGCSSASCSSVCTLLLYLSAVASVPPDPHHSQLVWLPEITAELMTTGIFNQQQFSSLYKSESTSFLSNIKS